MQDACFLDCSLLLHLVLKTSSLTSHITFQILYGLGWPQLEEVCENIKDQPSPPRVKDLLSGTQALLLSQMSLF